MTMHSRALALLVAVLVLLPSAPAAGDGGRIAFLSDRSGSWALWAVDGDGTGLRPLTDARMDLLPYDPIGIDVPNDDDGGPVSWSPDGRQIAFEGRRSLASSPSYALTEQLSGTQVFSRYRIFVADGDRVGPPRRLTPLAGRRDDLQPVWSPDGRFIAFTRLRDDSPDAEVWTVDLASGEQRRVVDGWGPTWSADGRRLAAYDLSEKSWVTAAPDGSDIRVIAPDPEGRLDDPAWSPAGGRLAFRRDLRSVVAMNVDGRRRRILFAGAESTYLGDLGWSPDGCWLAYTTTDFVGPAQVLVQRPRPRQPRVVASFPMKEPFSTVFGLAWSPDGKSFALSELQGDPIVPLPEVNFYISAVDVLVVPFDGGVPRRVMDESPPVWDLFPVWRPEPAARPEAGKRCRPDGRRPRPGRRGRRSMRP